MAGVPYIYGVHGFGPEQSFASIEACEAVLHALREAGVTRLNTGQLYGESEKTLGILKAGECFTIDTKAAGGLVPGALEAGELVRRAKESLQKLNVSQVDTLYLHMPDHTVPITDTLSGVQKLFETGMFRHFGLSNYLAADVELIHKHCTTHHIVLPTVYQGSYNPVARQAETELFPTLRRLGIKFYAYGPQAGGFLAKTKEEVVAGKGRLDPGNRGGQRLRRLYCRPPILEALVEWGAIAASAGCSGAELSCRWVKHNSALKAEHGDAVIFSTSTIEQTHDTLRFLEAGPLPDRIVQRIDALWEMVKAVALLDNINE